MNNLEAKQKRTLLVIVLSTAMMVVEVVFGYLTGSLSLLADGWHMASHTGALGITYLAYAFARSPRWSSHFAFGTGKIIALGGYTSAVCLALVALMMASEAFSRLVHPNEIQFDEALLVAGVGLIVNFAAAYILGNKDQEEVHDHNIKSAYYHVLADALTSFLAIIALLIGKYFDAPRADVVIGGLGSILILHWAYQLCKETAWELLDGHAKTCPREKIIGLVQDANSIVTEFRVWTVGPGEMAGELVVVSKSSMGSDYFREKISREFSFKFLTIEEKKA